MHDTSPIKFGQNVDSSDANNTFMGSNERLLLKTQTLQDSIVSSQNNITMQAKRVEFSSID